MVSHPFLGEVECSDESSFSEGGGPLRSQGEGGVPVCNRHQEEGRGDRDESPFPRMGWGDRDELSFSGGGGPHAHEPNIGWTTPFQGGVGETVIRHSEGACPKGGERGSTNHSQGEGVEGRLC